MVASLTKRGTLMDLNKEELKAQLVNKVATVVFTKADGKTLRTMKCTLNPADLPERTDTDGPTKFPNPETVAVWDLENKGWRSFRLDSVKEISFE